MDAGKGAERDHQIYRLARLGPQLKNRSLAMPFLVTRKPVASVETRTRFLLAPRLTCLSL